MAPTCLTGPVADILIDGARGSSIFIVLFYPTATVPYMTRTFAINKRTTYYKDKFTRFDALEVEYETTREIWPSVFRLPFVSVIPVSDKGRTAIIRQHRFAVNQEMWEFCRGGVDDGENMEQAAIRELAEELDIHTDRVEKIGCFYPETAVIEACGDVYVAYVDDAVLDRINPNINEDQITARRVLTLGELDQMIDRGEIPCGMTLATYGLLCRHFARKKEQGE